MSLQFQISLDEKARLYLSKLMAAPAAAQREILKTIDRENVITVGRIQKDKLSRRGPETLGVISNRLRGSIRSSRATIESDGGIYSSIGSNVAYAGIHEFGFKGSVRVKAHTRRIERVVLESATRAVFDPKTGRIKKEGRKKKKTSELVVQVRAHSRLLDVPARAFIRRTVEERSTAYTIAIGNTVQRLLS